jgi:hypothetical protein
VQTGFVILRIGHVPLTFDDPAYKNEVQHEKDEGFPPCMCSNCMGHLVKPFVQNLKNINRSNFSDYVLNKVRLELQPTSMCHNNHSKGLKRTIEKPIKIKKEEMLILKDTLKKDCHDFIESSVGTGGTIVPSRFFSDSEAQAIVRNINHICDESDMRRVINGEVFRGQIKVLMRTLEEFKRNRSAVESNDTTVNERNISTDVTNPRPTERDVVDERVEDVEDGKRGRNPVWSSTSAPVTRKKRCSTEEAQAKRAAAEEKKRIRTESKNTRDAELANAKRIRREEQQKIMAEVKQAYGMTNGDQTS